MEAMASSEDSWKRCVAMLMRRGRPTSTPGSPTWRARRLTLGNEPAKSSRGEEVGTWPELGEHAGREPWKRATRRP